MGRMLPASTTHAIGQLHTAEQSIRGSDTDRAKFLTDQGGIRSRKWSVGSAPGGRSEPQASALSVVEELPMIRSTPRHGVESWT